MGVSLVGSIGLARADAPGVTSGLLASCPDRRNCVASDATDERHRIAPFRLRVPADAAWRDLISAIESMPGAKIVAATPDYLRAEFTSALLGFTDDAEFLLRPQQGEIAVRSASRIGYYDFGANRERIEALRAKLRERGVLE
jgi:uncharacterized protein (DUF1499 family)